MYTVIESPLFQSQWPDYWSEDERGEFSSYIAGNPFVGDVVPGSGGIRKVRWQRSGRGKSGGVRVIYFVRTIHGEIILLTIYSKAKTGTLSPAILKGIRRAIEK
jgi:mRNA-degrading endonuclease RelE of RelBE toxin-antitoxin system